MLATGATVLLAVGTFLVGVGAASTRVSDSTGGSRRSALIMSLAVGQCFDFPSEGHQDLASDVEVFGVEVMPCEEPHDNEIVGVFDDDADVGAPYPGLQELMATVSDRCLDEFEAWVDTTFETSSLDVRVIGPTADGWSLGDRTILYAASRVDEQKLDRSVQASGI